LPLNEHRASGALDQELRNLCKDYADKLRNTYEKRKATLRDQLIAETPSREFKPPSAEACRPAQKPSFAGHPLVLLQLKSRLGIVSADQAGDTTQTGLDAFEMPAESPLREAHERLSSFLSEAAATQKYHSDIRQFPAGQSIFALDEDQRGQVLVAACERRLWANIAPSWSSLAAMPSFDGSTRRASN
jgi:hypothetical protein